jgi:ATP-binding cassette, subfamily B (MDR/TAP), member 1
MSSGIGPAANRYRRGLGRKFGEGVQFLITGIGGIVYGLFASWRIALVVMATLPFVSVFALMVVTLNQTKSSRAGEAYSQAGSIAYSSVSAIRTVLSLNAVPAMVKQYSDATLQAFRNATGTLLKQGFANGAMLGSFLCLYAVLALYGTALLYKDIEDTGCDPTTAVPGNQACDSSGPDVFGAMLGVAFAGQGISQVGNFLETFAAARVAVHGAMKAINRKKGAPEEKIYADPEEDLDLSKTNRSGILETAEGKVKAILPKYEIDSSSDEGLKPTEIKGQLTFEKVSFTYPTRPGDPVLENFSIDIEAGKTIAFVGPSVSKLFFKCFGEINPFSSVLFKKYLFIREVESLPL